jgi:hypothetical protein
MVDWTHSTRDVPYGCVRIEVERWEHPAGEWRVECAASTIGRARPYYVMNRSPAGHWTGSHLFRGYFGTPETAMRAVERAMTKGRFDKYGRVA